MVDIDGEHLAQTHGLWATVDQGNVVNAEGVFQRGVAVELFQDGFRVETCLDFDHQLETVVAIREVDDVRNTVELFARDAIFDFVDDLFRTDQVGEFGNSDAHFARGDAANGDACTCLETATTGFIGFADTVQAHDHTTGGKIWSRHERHQVVQRCLGVPQEVNRGFNDLNQVVGSHVGGHTHCNTARTVYQQVGIGRRKNIWLLELVVIVRNEVDDVFIKVRCHGKCRSSEAGFGVAGSSRAVIQRTEVTVSVNQRKTEREVLSQANEGVVDRSITMRVKLSHHFTNNTRRLYVALVGAQTHLTHHEQDAALNGLEAVSCIGQCTGVNH